MYLTDYHPSRSLLIEYIFHSSWWLLLYLIIAHKLRHAWWISKGIFITFLGGGKNKAMLSILPALHLINSSIKTM